MRGRATATIALERPHWGAGAIQAILLLQLVILVGLGVALLLLNGLPDQTAQLLPDFSGGHNRTPHSLPREQGRAWEPSTPAG